MQQTPECSDELEYLAGIAVTSGSGVPSGMVTFTLPAAQYAKFGHRGKVELVDRTVSYIYSSWLAQSGMRHTYSADIEFYGPEYSPASDASVIHYVIPIVAG